MDNEKNKVKTPGELLKEKLLMKPKNGFEVVSDEVAQEAFSFAQGYKAFLDGAKTERKAIDWAVQKAREAGARPFEEGKKYAPGEKFFLVNRGKNIILGVAGEKGVEEGLLITAAHIDSPRLDLKPNPLYEESDLAFFKTHYYGGIKKYQWTAIPLALEGVVAKKDGGIVEISIGSQPNEPVFCVTDLLPHLACEQMAKPMKDAVTGEGLNILIGSRPFKDDKAGELVKLNIMRLLNEKYDLVEADFVSAELSLVPAWGCRDVGLDQSFIGGYGHDDRCCAYPSFMALLGEKAPRYTCLCVLADKEESGSDGNTGMQSRFFENLVSDMAQAAGLSTRRVIEKSLALSADVNAAFDPNYPEVLEKRNSAFAGRGVSVTKYTGARGKSDTSDASAEFVAKIRKIFDAAGVLWQTGELGKVDQGGGGTVAKYLANLNMDVIDVGVPVLSMHAPFEVISKLDLYMAYLAFKAFYGRK